MTVIAFMGERKSGKDHFCEFIEDKFHGTRLSFSDEVRKLASNTFTWLPEHISPDMKDEPFDHPFNPFGFSPRQIWLQVAKVRDIDPHYFVRQFKKNQYTGKDPQLSNRLYIITDFRTPEEWEFLQQNKIPVIKINLESRDGIEPDAFEEYVRNFHEQDTTFVNKKDGTKEFEKFFKEFCKAKDIKL